MVGATLPYEIDINNLNDDDRRRFESFFDEFCAYPGSQYLKFACYAAIPEVITSDLLYNIWNNFFQDITTRKEFTYLAISDLLLSPIVSEISKDVFIIRPEIKRLLIEYFKSNFENNKGSEIKKVAKLVLAFLRYKPQTIPIGYVREATKWSAESIVDKEKAANYLKAIFKKLEVDHSSKQIYLFEKIKILERNYQNIPLKGNGHHLSQDLTCFLSIGKSLRLYDEGLTKEAAKVLKSIEKYIGNEPNNYFSLKVPIPLAVLKAFRHQPILEDDDPEDILPTLQEYKSKRINIHYLDGQKIAFEFRRIIRGIKLKEAFKSSYFTFGRIYQELREERKKIVLDSPVLELFQDVDNYLDTILYRDSVNLIVYLHEKVDHDFERVMTQFSRIQFESPESKVLLVVVFQNSNSFNQEIKQFYEKTFENQISQFGLELFFSDEKGFRARLIKEISNQSTSITENSYYDLVGNQSSLIQKRFSTISELKKLESSSFDKLRAYHGIIVSEEKLMAIAVTDLFYFLKVFNKIQLSNWQEIRSQSHDQFKQRFYAEDLPYFAAFIKFLEGKNLLFHHKKDKKIFIPAGIKEGYSRLLKLENEEINYTKFNYWSPLIFPQFLVFLMRKGISLVQINRNSVIIDYHNPITSKPYEGQKSTIEFNELYDSVSTRWFFKSKKSLPVQLKNEVTEFINNNYPRLSPQIITQRVKKAFFPKLNYIKGGYVAPRSLGIGASIPDNQKIKIGNLLIGQYPVTFEEYDAFCISNRGEYYFPSSIKGRRGLFPVVDVDWCDAISYCNWLSEISGLDKVYNFKNNNKEVVLDFSKTGYRLLTEAEWEFAASGGIYQESYEFSGGNDLKEVGWYRNNSKNRTEEVGKRKPNALNIFDMSGNVREWTSNLYFHQEGPRFMNNPLDIYHQQRAHSSSNVNRARITKGGAFNDSEIRCKISSYLVTEYKSLSVGFRVCRSVF